MIKPINVIVLFTLLGFSRADLCQDNFTITDAPGSLLEFGIDLLTSVIVIPLLGCKFKKPVVATDVTFYLYNRQNQNDPIILDPQNPIGIDHKKATKVLIHGWLCSHTNSRMPELKDAYLKRYDCNVVIVDWSKRSVDIASNAACSVPEVAEIVGDFLLKLKKVIGVNLKTDVHLLGHSMGAHVAGLAGQNVQESGALLKRITGMDPGGPIFQSYRPNKRLSKDDADFVDVIHTCESLYGFYGPCGAVDFFVNCGTFQPGCFKPGPVTSIEEIIDIPIRYLNCNHIRSIDYMIESINSERDAFKSTSCEECPGLPVTGPCFKDIIKPKYTNMGEYCPSNPPAAKFLVKTNGRSPFARGP